MLKLYLDAAGMHVFNHFIAWYGVVIFLLIILVCLEFKPMMMLCCWIASVIWKCLLSFYNLLKRIVWGFCSLIKRIRLSKERKNALAFGIVTVGLAAFCFWAVIYLLKSNFFSSISLLILVGFEKVFSAKAGEVSGMTYFFAALILAGVFFFCAALVLVLYSLLYKKKDFKKGAWKGTGRLVRIILHENRNVLFLILTIVISLVVLYSGTLFLSVAFPAEPLVVKGIDGSEGSHLEATGSYLNLINTFDVPCKLTLADKFNNTEIKSVQMKYYINRTEFEENRSSFSRDMISLYFDKQRQPTFVTITFEDRRTETFTINNKGVYTKEEYFAREKEKAVWFFAIISFSFFSVFSAMNNLKQVLGWK